MSDVWTNSLKYWNGMLSQWTANGYYSVVNFDIVAPTYSWYGQKQRNTSFYYKKRKWYNDVLPLAYSIAYRDWDISDIVTLNDSTCSEWQCVNYIMLVNRRSGKMKILIQDCNDCEIIHDLCWTNWLDVDFCDECFCDCQYDRFLKTDFVKWTPRIVHEWSFPIYWVQENWANGTVGYFYDSFFNWLIPSIQVWDWIYVYGSPNRTWDAVCGQARQVVWIERSTNPSDPSKYILNAVWTNLPDNKWINWEYAVYPERWDVLVYPTCDWLKTIHAIQWQRNLDTHDVVENNIADVTTACSWFSWDTCIYWVNEYWRKINILWSKWYNIFWWLSYDKFNFSADNLNYVWEDKLSQVVFRNFLVQFGKDNMNVIVYNTDWVSFSYKLDGSLWIFSKTAFVTFQNSLYIIGSDKRMYAVDITSNWMNWYMLNLTDQSQQIKWDLELLQEWDEVNMSADGKHLYIFINNKSSIFNSSNTKTRILKYYRDYNRWVTHDICCAVINRHTNWYFLWDSLFVQYINETTAMYTPYDCIGYNPSAPWDWSYINAYIEAFIWENEDWQTQFTTLAYKQIKWLKILLWKGIYTDWASKVVVDYWNHWYKQQYVIDKFEHIDRIDKNNKLRQWEEITPDECALELLAECTNVVRPCQWQPDANREYQQGKWCRPEAITTMDNCQCLDDVWFELSDVYNVFIDLQHLKKSELYKIKIMSTGWDEMVFGWMVAWVDTFDIATHDWENLDVLNNGDDCCVEWTFINENNPCWCP
jgi:hypothetical protein